MDDSNWQHMVANGKLGAYDVHYLEATPSTNTIAEELILQGIREKTLVVAGSQSAGRGRMSRRWFSPPATGLYFSVIATPGLAPRDLPKMTLAAGVAVAAAIEQLTPLSPLLKWPNDLFLAARKFGGILSQAVGRDHLSVIIGIGINVNTPQSSFPDDLRNQATSLAAQAGEQFLRSLILQAIMRNLDTGIQLLEQGKFAVIRQAWQQRDAITGRCSWQTPAGAVITGKSLGIDDDGYLWVRDDHGQAHLVMSGDVETASGE